MFSAFLSVCSIFTELNSIIIVVVGTETLVHIVTLNSTEATCLKLTRVFPEC